MIIFVSAINFLLFNKINNNIKSVFALKLITLNTNGLFLCVYQIN